MKAFATICFVAVMIAVTGGARVSMAQGWQYAYCEAYIIGVIDGLWYTNLVMDSFEKASKDSAPRWVNAVRQRNRTCLLENITANPEKFDTNFDDAFALKQWLIAFCVIL